MFIYIYEQYWDCILDPMSVPFLPSFLVDSSGLKEFTARYKET